MTQMIAMSNGPSFKALLNHSFALMGYVSQVSAAPSSAHRKLLSESFRNPMDTLPDCAQLIANLKDEDTVALQKGEGWVINDRLVNCSPEYKVADWPAIEVDPNSGCMADRLTIKRGAEPALHIELEGKFSNCKMTHAVMKQAGDFTTCSGQRFLEVSPTNNAKAAEKHYHPEKIKSPYGSAIFDPQLKECTQSLLQRINAYGVTRDAARITALTAPFAFFFATVINADYGDRMANEIAAAPGLAVGNRLSLTFALTHLLAMTTRNILTSGAQLAFGGLILDSASWVGGMPNPESEYSGREGALQGLLGGAAIGVLTGLVGARYLTAIDQQARTVPVSNFFRKASTHLHMNVELGQFLLNQFVAPAVGSALLGLVQANRQGPRTATLASLSACFTSLVLGNLIRNFIEKPVIKSIAASGGGGAQEIQLADRAETLENHTDITSEAENASMHDASDDEVSVSVSESACPSIDSMSSLEVVNSPELEIENLIATLEREGLELEELLLKRDPSLSSMAICPISQSIMKDPVIVPSRALDAHQQPYSHTFDRTSIIKAVSYTGKHPITSENLTQFELRATMLTDQRLRAMIFDFLQGVQREKAHT